jgi:hypothetical protein
LPSTLSAGVVPVTAEGVADAGVVMVGTESVMVMFAEPAKEDAVAVIVADPAALGELYNPLLLIDPMPEDFAQVKLGWLVSVFPNWSYATAEKACV